MKIERFSFDPCDAILTQTASKVKTALDKHIGQTKSGKKKENLLDQPRVVEPTKENLLDQKRFDRPTPLSCASDENPGTKTCAPEITGGLCVS